MKDRQDVTVDDALLASWPLPPLDAQGDKESRGRVLVVAGSRELPGAALLSATAALRAGAGKLVVATPACVAPGIALAIPEARVIALPETASHGIAPAAIDLLAPLAEGTCGMLVGPGLVDRDATVALVPRLLDLFRGAGVVLDALAMDAAAATGRFERPVVLTPHAGEMAHLTGQPKDALLETPGRVARTGAARWNAVLALKGAVTCVADPGGALWTHEASLPGLGTSGSGDVLAGLLAGLLARGAPPQQAAVWAVALHARAGLRLAQRLGGVGFLARELAGEVPALLQALGGAAKA